MILTFPDVITPDDLDALRAIGAASSWVDGRESASPRLADRKRNEQLSRDDPKLVEVARIVGGALQRHRAFCARTLPRHMHSLRLAQYGAGMRYGRHVDAAFMQDGPVRARADLSFTLFLSDPADYDGGELALETGGDDLRVKLPARHLVCYATGELHEVREVTRGVRSVVVGWIESVVRDAGAREALADIGTAIELVHEAEGPSRAYDLLVKSHANLLRRWADG